MAYVKILWNRNVVALEKYMFDGRDMDDPVEMNGCLEDFVSEHFIGTQVHFGDKTGLSAIHVIQSFDKDDSHKLSPDEFSLLGRKLIERQFPGHQFCVVTHTETDKVHNHIMINPVRAEDGRRIHNKTRLLYDLREKSDEICRSQGLSVIEEQSSERWKQTPEKVREIKRRGGFSWVLDFKEKADFARSIATSYDEYAAVLNQFGIQVRVENKNISYHYPGRKPKRGDTRGLGQRYSKDGLVENFRENYALFLKAGLKTTPIEKIDFQDHWKFQRGINEYFIPSYRYKDLVVPPSLLKIVQGIDIEKQASDLGLELINRHEGKKVIRGRDHIQIDGHHWTNEKTGANGGALEFINYLHQESWLKTLERYDTKGDVKKVLKVAREVRPTFKAFYIPSDARKRGDCKKQSHLGSLDSNLALAKKILSDGQVTDLPNGRLKLRPADNPKVSLTLHQRGVNWVCRNPSGVSGAFFQRLKGPKDRLLVFEDPMAFLGSGRFLDRISKNQIPMNIYVPLKPIDQFLKQQPALLKKYPKVTIVRSEGKLGWGRDESIRFVNDDEIRLAGGELDLSYRSIDELLKELVLGRSRQ